MDINKELTMWSRLKLPLEGMRRTIAACNAYLLFISGTGLLCIACNRERGIFLLNSERVWIFRALEVFNTVVAYLWQDFSNPKTILYPRWKDVCICKVFVMCIWFNVICCMWKKTFWSTFFVSIVQCKILLDHNDSSIWNMISKLYSRSINSSHEPYKVK